MKNLPKRLLIFSRDMENITGYSARSVRRLRRRILRYYNKKQNDFITVREFCDYMGIDEQLVQENLIG